MKHLLDHHKRGARAFLIVLTILVTAATLATTATSTASQRSPSTDRGVMRLQTSVSPFVGEYIGAYGTLPGHVTISDSGQVRGYFYSFSRSGSQELRFSGEVTDDGVMRISGSYRYTSGRREKGTSHFRSTAYLTPDADGNLTVEWADGFINTWYRQP